MFFLKTTQVLAFHWLKEISFFFSTYNHDKWKIEHICMFNKQFKFSEFIPSIPATTIGFIIFILNFLKSALERLLLFPNWSSCSKGHLTLPWTVNVLWELICESSKPNPGPTCCRPSSGCPQIKWILQTGLGPLELIIKEPNK